MVSIKSHLLTDSVKSNLAAVASGKIVERIVYLLKSYQVGKSIKGSVHQFDRLPHVKLWKDCWPIKKVTSNKIVKGIVHKFDKLPQVIVLKGLFINLISYLRLLF